MADPLLVSIDLRFVTTQDPEQLSERVREAVRMVVGSGALEEFRWRSHPLGPERRPEKGQRGV
ncbi:MAG: hypothetical protein HY658_02790 [Actinobacteria bacterium]|nr:hypothetical protein [Actinomycetota bacterium]